MSLRTLAIAAGIVFGLAGSTAASAAVATGNVNLRTGPGTGFPVITVVPAGSHVDVRSCASRWCSVLFRGVLGWMSAAYVGRGPVYRAPPPYSYRYYRRPPPPPVYYPGPYGYRLYGPGFYFGYGVGPWW